MTFIMPSEIIHKQRTDWDGVLEDLFGIGKFRRLNRSLGGKQFQMVIGYIRAFI